MYWTHNLNPVVLSFGRLTIRWYGLMYLLGFILGYKHYVFRYRRGLFSLNPEHTQNLITYIMIGMMIFARLTYVVVYNPMYYWAHPSEIPAIWQGGLSFHGAAIGFILAVYLYGRRHGFTFYQIMDSTVFGAAQGIIWGRIGNFINGELPGRVSDVPWAMIFPDSGGLPRHPSQLYQSFCEGFLVFVSLYLIERYERKNGYAPDPVKISAEAADPKKKKVMVEWKRTGVISTWFLILYGLARFTIEFFREPDSQLGYFFGWMTMGQILCLLMMIAGIILLTKVIRKPLPVTYEYEGAGT